jgi:hypothetical protein
MKWGWFVAAIVVWLPSAACIIGTLVEVAMAKTDLKRKPANFWGGIAFHGATAVLALWLFLKALGKG